MDTTAAELHAAWQIVVRDVTSQGAVVPEVVAGTWGDPAVQATAMTLWPDGSQAGISVPRNDTSAEQVAFLADQLQDSEVENLAAAGLPAVWPSCPHHPLSHPLQARVRDGTAVWICPTSSTTVARIGHLAPPDPQPSGR